LVTGFLSGRVDEDDQVPTLDVPGHLAALCGVRVDETDSQPEGVTREILWADDPADGRSDRSTEERTGAVAARCPADTVFDLVTPVDATALAHYGSGFYAGTAAVTRRDTGAGRVFYVGARLDEAGLRTLWDRVLGPAAHCAPGLERVRRRTDDAEILF